MLIPVIQIGFASFSIQVIYNTEEKELIYTVSALTYFRAGTIYRG